MIPSGELTIGILALQGAFVEHENHLRKVSLGHTIKVVQVRLVEDLNRCDALIIPGGESTTIAFLAKLSGLLEPLRQFVKTKPVWGTCAGAILLAKLAVGTKKGGQELIGGIDITIARNGWGSQVESMEASLSIDGLRDPDLPFVGVFIRAPVVLSLVSNPDSSRIQILARLPASLLPSCQVSGSMSPVDPSISTIVALKQGFHMVSTFHPELTPDTRFHEFFVKECVIPSLQ